MVLFKAGYLLGLLVLAVTGAPVPDVSFSQCECDAAAISHAFSFTAGGALGTLTAEAGQDLAFNCPGGTVGTVDTTFPATQGLNFNYQDKEAVSAGGLVSTVDRTFLNGVSPSTTMKSWYSMFRIQFNAGAAETQFVTLFEIANVANLKMRPGQTASPTTSPTLFTFEGFGADSSSLGTIFLTPSVSLNNGGAASYDGAIFLIGYHTTHQWIACFKLVSTASQCATLKDVAKNNVAADPTLRLILIDNVVSRTLSGKVNYLLLKSDAAWDTAVNQADDGTRQANAEAFLDANVPTVPESIPIPLASTAAFSGTEDTQVSINIDSTSYLSIPAGASSYTFNYSPSFGSVTPGTASDGIFGFTPAANLNDLDTDFTQTYTVQLGSCTSPAGTFDITVAPVNDIPTINTPVTTFNLFAGVQADPSTQQIIIANDVDQSTLVLDAGTATIQGSSDLALIELYANDDCSGSPVTTGDLAILNGNLVYCIMPLSGIVGDSATLVLQVKDDVGAAAASLVTFTFNGQNPLDIADNPVAFAGNEDTVGGITLTFTSLGVLQGGTATDFDVVIEAPLPSHGTLLVNSVPAVVGTPYPATSNVRFATTLDYLNRDGVNNYEDKLDNPIVDGCSNNVVGCPDTFTYHMQESGGSLVSATSQTVRIYVDAVDDGVASVTGEENFFVQSGVSTDISSIVVTSDKGNDVFDITLHIFSDDGVQFTISPSKTSDIVNGLPIADFITITAGDNCRNELCTDAEITGAPSILAALANTVKVRVVEGSGADPKVNFEVSATGQGIPGTHTMRFSFIAPKQAFFDKPENIYIVSGAGGGSLLFVLALMVYLRVQGRRMITKETLLTVAEQAVDIELRGEKGKHKKALNELDPKKSIKLNVDDEIFDWEKHIDKESGEVYFFNPKTGESQWDPPTVKNYSL